MVNRELSTLEKAFVARHVHRADLSKKDNDERKDDLEVLQQILGCSLWRIAGIRAELTKCIERRTKEPDFLRKQDVKFSRAYVGLAGSDREQEELQDEVANLLRVELAAIQRITGDIRKESRVVVEGLDQSVKGELPFLNLNKVRLLGGGAHADYDTPIRQKLRMVWENAIGEGLPQSMLSRTFGLIVPGKRCLDVPNYLRLGVPPRNIIALENGGDVEPRIAKAEFVFNARKYNIDYHTEDLADFLHHFRQRLGFAVLDFTGQMCPKYLDIAANLPLSERAVVIFNTWARRESAGHQEELLRLWKHQGLPEEEFTLEKARGFCMGLRNAGAGRKENWYFGSQIMEKMPILQETMALGIEHPKRRMEKNIELLLLPMLRKIIDLLNMHNLLEVRIDPTVCEGLVNLLRDMFKDVTFGDAYIREVRKFWYRSDIIQDSPYHTDIGFLHTPKDLYQRDLSTLVEFLMDCVRNFLQVLEEEKMELGDMTDRFKFSIMRGHNFVEVGDADKRDRLSCLLDGKMIGYRPVYSFLNAVQSYHAFREQYEGDSGQYQVGLPREEIT